MKKISLKKIVLFLAAVSIILTTPLSAQAAETHDKDTDFAVLEAKCDLRQTYTKEELRQLSALIFCEAGSESYNGKLAVGIVVMNRVHSNKYPNSVKGVIYQKGQFSPASSGALKKAMKAYDKGKFTAKNQKACIKAAKEALSGRTTVTINKKKVDMHSYLFFSGALKNHKLTIGNHKFK